MSYKTKSIFKNLKAFIFITLAAIGFLLGACNVTPGDSTPYYHISSLFRNYCLFNVGTSWTYQNEQSGETYEVKVKELNSYIGFHIKDQFAEAYSYDAVEIFYDTNTLQLSKSLISAGPTPADGVESNDLYRIFWNDGSFILAFAPGYKIGEEQRLGGQEGLYTNLEVLGSYTAGNQTYNDVYHSQVIRPETDVDSARYEFYMAPHKGLIQWIKVYKGKTTTYSLKSATIVQN
jgi:hypothetical protein